MISKNVDTNVSIKKYSGFSPSLFSFLWDENIASLV